MIKPSVKNEDGRKFLNSKGRELVCIEKNNKFVYFCFEDKKLVSIDVENINEYPLGSILYCKISEISKGIDSAFVLLPDKTKAFLRLDGKDDLKCGTNVCVRVTRSGSKNKLMSVKLCDEDCSHYREMSEVFIAESTFVRLVKEQSFDKIFCENRKIYDKLSGLISSNSLENINIHLYNDEFVPLNVLFSLSKCIEEATGKTVWLKSGANLYIETTQAMTVIDVNSAKKVSKDGKNDNIFEINREAADEILRQLDLRNISGIIIVDFISMSDKEDNAKLLDYLREGGKNQRNYTKIIDMTPLGLVEITRKKSGPTIYDLNLL